MSKSTIGIQSLTLLVVPGLRSAIDFLRIYHWSIPGPQIGKNKMLAEEVTVYLPDQFLLFPTFSGRF